MPAPLILIVEDEAPIRKFLRASLAEDHRLVEAETGAAALRHAAEQPPDLVILDLGLPDLDGQGDCTISYSPTSTFNR